MTSYRGRQKQTTASWRFDLQNIIINPNFAQAKENLARLYAEKKQGN